MTRGWGCFERAVVEPCQHPAMPDPPWPFIAAEVLALRVISERAMRASYTHVYPGVYVPKGTTLTATQRAVAAWLWSKRAGMVSGQSAAALLGARWVDGAAAAELIHTNRKPPEGIVVREETLAAAEKVVIGGIAVTSPARTGFDIGRYTVDRLKAVQRIDALMNATGVKPLHIEAVAAAHPGVRGLRRLHRVLPLVDGGAESPQETAARLALIDAGLPAPTTQYVIRGEYGEFIGRVDMAYEDVKVAIEYDGEQHWTDAAVRQRDIDKGVAYVELGWNVIRLGSELLWKRRATYIGRVTTALEQRGFVW
jgi:hypothetical protein